jgi:hypothetical protein
MTNNNNNNNDNQGNNKRGIENILTIIENPNVEYTYYRIDVIKKENSYWSRVFKGYNIKDSKFIKYGVFGLDIKYNIIDSVVTYYSLN